MKTICLTYLLLFYTCLSSYAQQEKIKNPELSHHYLGGMAGFSTGYGPTYRFWPGKFGGQITFTPVSSPIHLQLSIGLTMLYRLKSYNHINLFLYQGNHLYYNAWVWEIWHRKLDVNYAEGRQFHGIGGGLEWVISKRLSFNLMAGYSLSKYIDDNEWLLNLTGETGIFIRL